MEDVSYEIAEETLLIFQQRFYVEQNCTCWGGKWLWGKATFIKLLLGDSANLRQNSLCALN